MTNYKINNMAVIQYITAKNDMKVLAFHDYDIKRLKHRVSIHMCNKKVTSIQFYYNITTNEDVLNLKKEGTILQ